MPALTQTQAAALGIEPKFRYESIVSRIVAAAGEFVAIHPDELNGLHIASKQACLLQAGRKRNLKLTTTSRKPGVIFARLVVPQ
jgi:hypothetical protein